jgi:hypothetical protein
MGSGAGIPGSSLTGVVDIIDQATLIARPC